MTQKSRRKSNRKSTENPVPSLSDLLEELAALLRPRQPVRVPVRDRPLYPRRIRNR